MQNISFQGKSILMFDPKTYDKTQAVTSKFYRHLNPHNTYNFRNKVIFITQADAQNLAVIVRNEKDGIIKNVPISGKTEEIIKEIAEKAEELKEKSKEKLTAWIIGGGSFNNTNGYKTIKTVNKIADVICDRPDIDTSILTGSKKGEEKIVLHGFKKKLEITIDKNIKQSGSKPATIEENLENYFDIVELNNTEVF